MWHKGKGKWLTLIVDLTGAFIYSVTTVEKCEETMLQYDMVLTSHTNRPLIQSFNVDWVYTPYSDLICINLRCKFNLLNL